MHSPLVGTDVVVSAVSTELTSFRGKRQMQSLARCFGCFRRARPDPLTRPLLDNCECLARDILYAMNNTLVLTEVPTCMGAEQRADVEGCLAEARTLLEQLGVLFFFGAPSDVIMIHMRTSLDKLNCIVASLAQYVAEIPTVWPRISADSYMTLLRFKLFKDDF